MAVAGRLQIPRRGIVFLEDIGERPYRVDRMLTDLIEGIYRLLMSDEVQPTNIGNPNEMTVLQFAQEIKRLTGTKAPIEFRPLPEDDPKIRRPDITKARTLLGWEPKVPLAEGLQKTIDYFRTVVR